MNQRVILQMAVVIGMTFPLCSLAQEGLVAEKQFVNEHENVRVFRDSNRVMYYGAPMGSASDSASAARDWLKRYSKTLIDHRSEMVPVRESIVGMGTSTVFAFTQKVGGTPVEGSQCRIVVREPQHSEDVARVVLVSAINFVRTPQGGFPRARLRERDVVATISRRPQLRHISQWGTPELVILPPADENDRVREVWKVLGRGAGDGLPTVLSFFIDTRDASIVRVRNEVSHGDIEGDLTGLMTTGPGPFVLDEPLDLVALPRAKVSVGDEEQEADEAGTYLLEDLEEISQEVQARLAGPWVEVETEVPGFEYESTVLEETVTPPATVDFEFASDESELEVAQVNAYVHAHETHEFFAERVTDFEDIDVPVLIRTNFSHACTGGYVSADEAIYLSGAGTSSFGNECPNFSYQSIIVHEYGHFVADQLGINYAGAFREGYCDSLAIIRGDDPIMGPEGFNGEAIRDTVEANEQYPCCCADHKCGQVLSGIWWDLRLNLDDSIGEESLEVVQQLFVDWSMITTGALGRHSADELTVIELLTVDDDDSDIGNGTPNYREICAAFFDHGLECPLGELLFEFPDQLPTTVEVDGSTAFAVHVSELASTPQEDTGTLYYAVNGGPWLSAAMEELDPNEYEATFGELDCEDAVEYYFGVENTLGDEVLYPRAADELGGLVAVAGAVEMELLREDFDDPGAASRWTVGADDDEATTGQWELVTPIGTTAAPALDHSADGTQCFVTGQGTLQGRAGENDVDDGATTLFSPELRVFGSGRHIVSYWVWFSNAEGASPNEDTLRTEVSSDGGSNWEVVKTYGPDGAAASRGWHFSYFDVGEFVSPNSNFQVRFICEDAGDGSLVEAALDDFRFSRHLCVSPGTEFVRGDCNSSGEVNLIDVTFLLRLLFAGGPRYECGDACDADDSGIVSLVDAMTLLSVLFLNAYSEPPFPDCDDEETTDQLSCDYYTGCP